ncbi:hypothetical protein LTR94_034325, partial [Friedmanniomyces endolithicus]
ALARARPPSCLRPVRRCGSGACGGGDAGAVAQSASRAGRAGRVRDLGSGRCDGHRAGPGGDPRSGGGFGSVRRDGRRRAADRPGRTGADARGADPVRRGVVQFRGRVDGPDLQPVAVADRLGG